MGELRCCLMEKRERFYGTFLKLCFHKNAHPLQNNGCVPDRGINSYSKPCTAVVYIDFNLTLILP